MADTLGSMVIQDLTYTQARHGVEFSVSYLNGGVAGSETVTVVDRHIRVTIASGVSTAAQVKAAVEANYDATLLVTVTVSGTASNAQKTSNAAHLSGGRAVSSAVLSVGEVFALTAVAAGAAGNTVTLVFADTATAGSETVSVIGNDIVIGIEEGVSTYQQVVDAYNAETAATALATLSLLGKAPYAVLARVSHLPDVTNLDDGFDAVAPAVVVQDLTYAAIATGVAANGKTLTYTDGAVAGAEIVTVSPEGNISVQIESGVSTATQIETALNAETDFTDVYSVSVSGTGSNVQLTVNSVSLILDEATRSTKDYYSDQTIVPLTSQYEPQYFKFHAESIIMYNDEASGERHMEWSLNGADTGGRLYPGESIVLDHLAGGRGVISLRCEANGVTPSPLLSAANFAILGASAVTNTGSTVIDGDVGVYPGSSVTGFPPGTFTGTLHEADTVAQQAHDDATAAAAALQLMGPGTDITSTDLGGYVAVPGVYSASSTGTWTAGNLTLNGAGTYVFLFGTALTMPANASVVLTNGATANNVYFVTGSAFTFGADNTVNGTILAGTSITFASNSVLNGRALVYGPAGEAVTFPSAGVVNISEAEVVVDGGVDYRLEVAGV